MDRNRMAAAARAESVVRAKEEPRFREANITVFFVLMATAIIFVLVYFLKHLPIAVDTLNRMLVLFTVLAFVGMIAWGIAAYLCKRFYRKRIYYYISYGLAGLCVAMIMLIVLLHYGEIRLNAILGAAGTLAFSAVANLVVLSAGRLERTLSALLLLLAITVLIIGIVLWSNGNLSIGVPLFFAGLSLTALESSILIYVMSGNSFFEILATSYLAFVLIAAVVALLVVAQSDSCDCDCAPDCSPSSGGRRKKSRLEDVTRIIE